MTSQERGFQDFAHFAAGLQGDENSEAQTFLFHLLEAFNHDANTLPENSTFEYRARFSGDRTKFADFVWPGRVFDTFPWPQFSDSRKSRREEAQTSSRKSQRLVTSSPTGDLEKIRAVAEAAIALRQLRREIMDANNWSLRELYKSLETPGENRLRTARAALAAAVRGAYGMKPDEDILAFLLKLNLELADKESKGEPVMPPGVPSFYPDAKKLVTEDCIKPATP